MQESETSGVAGKVALITGGARGIGYAIAEAFLRRGARAALCSRNPGNLKAAEARLREQGEVLAEVADVSDPAQVERLREVVLARFARVDVLINNAGVAWDGDFAAQGYDSIDEIIDVNVKGTLYVTRALLPHMLECGRGVIVNVSSGAGLAGFAGLVTYCASKFAIVGFTESLDLEVRDRGIRVYAVCPGRVATDMQAQYSGQRIGMPPAQVADRIVQLAGPHPRARRGSCVTL